ncbi:HRDC domain-containing protein [Actinomyces sp. B33]|uniref:HRDC domain-containing protein n=1 Tax=Actinomyces sp. B33 TaxID=2942131 RepID=UPI002341EA04|nr:HRDC domain-containing protein [Actinomyces sp. B33]MDC4233201.1 HRDC domain-containing protein [Actinomyces sp. B33]
MLIDNRDGLPQGDTEDPVLIAAPRAGVPAIIDSPTGLARAAEELATGSSPIALDVERAQGFRYGADPYLVQIRREGVGTYLIDTAALPDLSPLQAGVDDVWILHNAEQDLPNLRSTGLACPQLFDTEIAARLTGLTRFGLAAVCEQVLGLALVKDHQASDWSVRPLPPDWLRYAALDVELLTELYRHLSVSLHDMGRWEWALEEFAYAASRPAPEPKPDRWRGLPGAGKIRSRRSLAVLRELWEAREAVAERIDLSPGRLIRNAALVRAAQQPPRNQRALMSLSEFRSPRARQYADTWMRAITRAMQMEEDRLPSVHRPHVPGSVPDARHWGRIDEKAARRLALVRDAVSGIADRLGLAPEIVLEPRVQRYVAWAPLDPSRESGDEVEERMYDHGARDWQMDVCLDPICDALEA